MSISFIDEDLILKELLSWSWTIKFANIPSFRLILLSTKSWWKKSCWVLPDVYRLYAAWLYYYMFYKYPLF